MTFADGFRACVTRCGVLLLGPAALGCADAPAGSEEAERLRSPIVYGADDREEAFSLPLGSTARRVAAASAALIDVSRLDLSDPARPALRAPTLQQRFGVCEGERFADQPTAASCSATLIAPDLIATAGHCISEANCTRTKIVFGYALSQPGELRGLSSNDVYDCLEVVDQRFFSDIDYAVVRLDRPAPVDLLPFKVGKLPLDRDAPLVIAGHPSGLPLKITDGAYVVEPRAAERDFFLSNLDSFPGNSGSGVFLAESGELAGILVRGPNPGYEVAPGQGCTRPEQASADSPLIEAVYLHHPLAGLCAVAPEARLCACGDGRCDGDAKENTATCAEDCGASCGDGECNGAENGDECYEDCGACGNRRCEAREVARLSCVEDCGCPPGTEREGPTCARQRGNLNGDELVDAADLRAWDDLQCGARPARPSSAAPYLRVADVNCDGRSDAADRRGLSDFVAGRRAALPCDTPEALALGAQHSCALLAAGRVRCWGGNHAGQLGLATTEAFGDDESAFDAPVLELGGRVLQLAAGAAHTCALLDGGRVRCWGEGASGKLGLGDANNLGDDEPPVSRPPIQLGARAIAVAAGGSHSCAILEGGAVRCWGDNQFGQLGTGQAEALGDDEPPTEQPALRFGVPITALALGFDHTCALGSDGSVRCWGGNLFGQLGRGDPLAGGPLERAELTPPLQLGGPVQAIATSTMSGCALRQDASVLCWGQNFFGELGYPGVPVVGDDEHPIEVGPVPIGVGLRQLVLGQNRSCGLYEDGKVKCWGLNFGGELGYGHTLPLPLEAEPATLEPLLLGAEALQIAAGFGHTCAIVAGGRLRCWGANDSGQLGYGTTLPVGASTTPASAGDVPMTRPADLRWRFINPHALQVWVREGGGQSGGANLALFVANAGPSPIGHFQVLSSFSTAEQPEAVPVLRERRLASSTLRIERERATLFTLEYDFADVVLGPGERSSGGARTGEQARLTYSDRPSEFSRDDDYAAVDLPLGTHERAAFRLTKRAQLLDEVGRVIYGYVHH
jgi:alpha-tubulin suppressor-like RCC1 family protein